ncbi:MAG: radical SAM protein [Candidatus Krumholzibacteriales bacterium]
MADERAGSSKPETRLMTYLRAMLKQTLKSPLALPGLVSRVRHLISVIRKGEKLRGRRAQELGVPIPFLCIFSVTWKCNLNCRGCYAKNYTVKEELSPELISETIDECIRQGIYFFVIAGGEPLLIEGLPEKLASFRDAFFLFYTNGMLLKPLVPFFGEAGNILPVISAEGMDHYTDMRRGRGVAAGVEAAMMELRDNRIPFGFSTMITHINLKDVTSREWLQRQWDLGARFGFFTDYIPFEKNLNESFVLTSEDREFKKAALDERRKEAKPPIFNLPPDEYEYGECMAAGRGMIHINADGYVEPCPYSHFAADNIRDKSIGEILQSGFLRQIRDIIPSLENPDRECMLFSNSSLVEEVAERAGGGRTER